MARLGVQLTVWSDEACCPNCGHSRLPLLKLYVWPLDGFPPQATFEMVCDECEEPEEFHTIAQKLYVGDGPPPNTVEASMKTE